MVWRRSNVRDSIVERYHGQNQSRNSDWWRNDIQCACRSDRFHEKAESLYACQYFSAFIYNDCCLFSENLLSMSKPLLCRSYNAWICISVITHHWFQLLMLCDSQQNQLMSHWSGEEITPSLVFQLQFSHSASSAQLVTSLFPNYRDGTLPSSRQRYIMWCFICILRKCSSLQLSSCTLFFFFSSLSLCQSRWCCNAKTTHRVSDLLNYSEISCCIMNQLQSVMHKHWWDWEKKIRIRSWHVVHVIHSSEGDVRILSLIWDIFWLTHLIHAFPSPPQQYYLF